MKENIIYKELHRQLFYDPETGIFTRLVSNAPMVAVGDIAGHKNSLGYIEISLNSKTYLAHRLAWLYVHGYFPENDLDHINQIKHNNWINNLRETSRQCNMRNTGNSKRNKSGVKGVSWNNMTSKWIVQISVNKKNYYIGLYINFYEAVCARLAIEQCIGWSYCNKNTPAYNYVKKMLNGELN